MSSFKIAILFVLLQVAAQLAPQQDRPVEKASIEGVVLQAGTGEALSRAQVRLTRVLTQDDQFYFDGTSDPTSDGLPSSLTETDGKFSLRDLVPGQYRLNVSRNGYAHQTYGQKTPNGEGTIINLIPGETLKNVTFRLIQAGTVTGRVRDSSGEPIAGMSVALLRMQPGEEGRKALFPADSASTDDRGEYRLFWIQPGRYYLKVSPTPDYAYYGNRKVVADPSIPSAYYPGSLDLSVASVLEVQAGSELAGIDVIVPKPTGHWIRGRVVDGATGKPPRGASVDVSPKVRPAISENDFSAANSRSKYDSTTGTFEIRNVIPGSYWLSAGTSNNFDDPISAERLAEVRTGADVFEAVYSTGASVRVPIEMPVSDLNGIVLTLSRGNTVPVQVSVEGPDPSTIKGMDKVRVYLNAAEAYDNYRSGSRLNPQGISKIENVTPGEYRAFVDLPKSTGLYVKELRYGRNEALHERFQITDQQPDALTVLLSDRGGRLEGTLTDTVGQPLSGVEVVLIPDARDRNRLFRTENTDHDGHFLFTELTPGGYKLFSWEALEPRAYYDNDVLSKYDTQGRPVQIQESSKVTADLKIIPPLRQ